MTIQEIEKREALSEQWSYTIYNHKACFFCKNFVITDGVCGNCKFMKQEGALCTVLALAICNKFVDS